MAVQSSNNIVHTQMEKVRNKLPLLYELDKDLFFSSVEKKDAEKISERDMRIPMEMKPGGYFGYTDLNGGDLGIGDGGSFDKAVISTKDFKHAIQWNTRAQYGTDDSRKAVINLFQKLMSRAMPEFRVQTENQCMTSGNGVLATVTSLATTTVTNDTVTCTTDGYRVKLIRPGQRVQVYDSTLATNRTAVAPVKVLSVDIPNNKFVLESTVSGITAGDFILPEGLAGASPVGLYGVPYYVTNSTSGTMLGFTRSTTPEVVSNRINAGGGALAVSFCRRAVNSVGDRLGNDNKKSLTAWTHPAQAQAYEALAQQVSIINKEASEQGVNLFFNDNMRLAGVPVKQSFRWDRKRIDFLTTEYWGRAELTPIHFYGDYEHEGGGRRIWEIRGSSGGVVTSNVFYIVASWNLFCENPAAQAYIDNLAIPTGY